MSRLGRIVGQLTTGSVALAAANGSVALLATRWLPPHDRGVLAISITVPSIVSIIATLGIGNALRARRPGTGTQEMPKLVRAYTAAVTGSVLAGVLLTAGVCVALAPLTDGALASWPVAAGAAAAGGVLVLATHLSDAWFSAGRFTQAAGWAATAAAVGLATVVVVRPTTVGGFLAAQYLPALCPLMMCVVALAREGLVEISRPDWSVISALIVTGFPSVGFVAGAAIILRVDRLVLAGFVTPEVVAAYALASTVSEVGRLVPLALGQVALHRTAATGSDLDGQRLARQAQLAVLAAGAVLLPVSIMAMPAVFGPAYATSASLLGIMLVGELFFSAYVVRSMALMGAGRTKVVGRIGVLGALASVPAYGLGSALGGAVGCAAAGVFVYATLALSLRPARRRVLT